MCILSVMVVATDIRPRLARLLSHLLVRREPTPKMLPKHDFWIIITDLQRLHVLPLTVSDLGEHCALELAQQIPPSIRALVFWVLLQQLEQTCSTGR